MRGKSEFILNKGFFTILFCVCISVQMTIGQTLDNRPDFSLYQSADLLEVNTPAASQNDSVIAILGARLVDGLGGAPMENSVVIVDGTRILAVGKQGSVDIPQNVIRINANGKTLMPGLIDSHLHSVNDDEFLSVILNNGTTALRDPGHPFRFYQVLDFVDRPMPRVYLTGADLDGYPGVHKQQAILVKNHGHARQVVHDHVRNGGTGIKIYFRLPLEYYDPIVKAAQANGIPVFAHLELVDADDAIRAGLDGIEHVTSFGTALADPADAKEFKDNVRAHSSARSDGRYQLWSKIDLSSQRVKDVIKVAVENDVIFSPTLTTFERQAGDARAKDYEVKAFNNMVEFVGMAHKAGVRIVTGSHTSGWYADYGLAYQREMELLLEAGLTPMEVIQSSTLINADYFGASNRIGSIEKGKLADLLLIDGNPLEDISAMHKISQVMLNGIWVK